MHRKRFIAIGVVLAGVAIAVVLVLANRRSSPAKVDAVHGSATTTAVASARVAAVKPDEPGRIAVIDRNGRRVGTASATGLAAKALPPDDRAKVIDGSGAVKGYVLPGFGFVSLAVASDPAALHTLEGCAQTYALVEQQIAADPAVASKLSESCRATLKRQGGSLDPRLDG